MTSLALLIVRATVGSLLAGHGAQKLFGAFGGHGIEGTAGWLESMNLRPGRPWAQLAGWSELGGGVLTAMGALNPIGPIMAIGSMLMATIKVHRAKPVWVTEGGAELPLTNMAVMGGLVLAGPGRLSLDALLGIRVPRWFGLSALLATVAMVALGVRSSEMTLDGEASDQEQTAGQRVQTGGATPADDEDLSVTDPAPAGRPDLARDAPRDRPGIESWGSPDVEEPAHAAPVAAIRREVP